MVIIVKLEIKNLSKKFKNNIVIDNANIKMESGKIYAFIGRNGSGKSVLLKIICGFYAPTKGEVLLDGLNITDEQIFLSDTRALIEHPSFLDNLSGYENLKVLAQIQNKISDNEILKALDDVNLLEQKDKKYSTYSLGMKQKLGIAQVLMEDPKIMIFDEPFNGVEEDTVKKIRKKLYQLKNKGKIIIIATHIKDDIEKLANNIFYFDAGRVNEIKKDNLKNKIKK